MKSLLPFATIASCAILTAFAPLRIAVAQKAIPSDAAHDFRTSHSCITCHNNLKTAKGEDISFASAWSASMLANAAYDPYWQGSVRRESVDHPEVNSAIQTECASCHMPLQYLRDKAQGHETQVFSRLPLSGHRDENDAAIEGVTCTVCHQIQPKGLGTPETANGKFTVSPGGTVPRPVFGPFGEAPDRVVAIHLNSSGYAPKSSTHIRDAALCGTCHTLYTTAFGPGGKEIGRLPEQMTYLEWQQSSFKETKTCQECHMPPVEEQAKIATAFSTPHDGVHRHTFVGANFFMQQMLNAHHDELGVDASTGALTEAAVRTTAYLQSQAARITVGAAQLKGSSLSFSVMVQNLSGHKFPTGFPSRRAWIHVVVTDSTGKVVFESGKLNPDGSIVGNANDTDPARYSPHFAQITEANQVEIFEPILGDTEDHVTTGLLAATHYLKDNRILPDGFDKESSPSDTAVRGNAATDPKFVGGSATTEYVIATHGAAGPLHVYVELAYQPVGYRWAHNLASYKADEPTRFVAYYDQVGSQSALVIARAETNVAAR